MTRAAPAASAPRTGPVPSNSFRLCLVHLDRQNPTETFARAHAELLPCEVAVVHGDGRRPWFLDGEPLLRRDPLRRARRLVERTYDRRRGRNRESAELSRLYVRAFRRARCDAVLAEFGQAGVQSMEACSRLGLPLIVHFHGYDAHSRVMLDRYEADYKRLFARAAAVIAVSTTMRDAMVGLGAPPERTYLVPNGVDPARFRDAQPGTSPPVFVAVGRFTDKKAPHLTVAAFAAVHERHPEARLRMIGDGPLLSACSDLAQGLGVGDAVAFLGLQPHDAVAAEMQTARAFVQHSVVAADGDSEGMPVGVLEASAAGLPVVSTRHAGIPEIVVDGETGFLVEERDVAGMAARMTQLVESTELAAAMGKAGRARVSAAFTLQGSVLRLWQVIEESAGIENANTGIDSAVEEMT